MRGVPRSGISSAALAVMVSDLCAAFAAARPVRARVVLAVSERGAIELRSGENVVLVRLVAATVDNLSLLRHRILLAQFVVGAVQIVDVFRDHYALGVVP